MGKFFVNFEFHLQRLSEGIFSNSFRIVIFDLPLKDASLASPNSDVDRKNAASPTKIRSDEEVETLQLTKKEKKSSLSSDAGDKSEETPKQHCEENTAEIEATETTATE